MKTEYAEWIAREVPDHAAAYGNCAEVTARMVEAFPDLRRVSGFYHCWAWGRRQHFWCVTNVGEVVDPTARQFPSAGAGDYQEVTNPSEVPTGVCMDCGADVYEGATFCDDECERRTRAYLGC